MSVVGGHVELLFFGLGGMIINQRGYFMALALSDYFYGY